MNMISISRVDGKSEKIAALLKWLQLETLPGDEPIDTNIGYWWIVYDEDKPIGFCSMKHSAKWADTIYLNRAGIIYKYRGKGLQRRLIRVRERLSRKFGMTWLVSDTYQNPASTNSLIRCGFQMYSPSYKYGADGTCYWRKKL